MTRSAINTQRESFNISACTNLLNSSSTCKTLVCSQTDEEASIPRSSGRSSSTCCITPRATISITQAETSSFFPSLSICKSGAYAIDARPSLVPTSWYWSAKLKSLLHNIGAVPCFLSSCLHATWMTSCPISSKTLPARFLESFPKRSNTLRAWRRAISSVCHESASFVVVFRSSSASDIFNSFTAICDDLLKSSSISKPSDAEIKLATIARAQLSPGSWFKSKLKEFSKSCKPTKYNSRPDPWFHSFNTST
mmetsp:Transcript_7540/g.13756  ORF Transcript_7540/g.13756 Transcript_7540/m.13756 type:complete len:252 (+) Transcript_7540:3874-4629(+)